MATVSEIISKIPIDEAQLCESVLETGQDELVKTYRRVTHVSNYMLTRQNQLQALTQLQYDKIADLVLETDFAALKSVSVTFRGQSEEFDNNMAISGRIIYQALSTSYSYLKEASDLSKWYDQLLSYRNILLSSKAELDSFIELFPTG